MLMDDKNVSRKRGMWWGAIGWVGGRRVRTVESLPNLCPVRPDGQLELPKSSVAAWEPGPWLNRGELLLGCPGGGEEGGKTQKEKYQWTIVFYCLICKSPAIPSTPFRCVNYFDRPLQCCNPAILPFLNWQLQWTDHRATVWPAFTESFFATTFLMLWVMQVGLPSQRHQHGRSSQQSLNEKKDGRPGCSWKSHWAKLCVTLNNICKSYCTVIAFSEHKRAFVVDSHA